MEKKENQEIKAKQSSLISQIPSLSSPFTNCSYKPVYGSGWIKQVFENNLDSATFHFDMEVCPVGLSDEEEEQWSYKECFHPEVINDEISSFIDGFLLINDGFGLIGVLRVKSKYCSPEKVEEILKKFFNPSYLFVDTILFCNRISCNFVGLVETALNLREEENHA